METARKPYVKNICSYQGATDYDINNQRYEVRYRPCAMSEGKRYTESIPFVGTVTRSHGRQEFAPADIVALFPGYVAARWNADFSAVEYLPGAQPSVTMDEFGPVASAGYPKT